MLKLCHNEIRKEQKKQRRKKIRQKIAKSRIAETILSDDLEERVKCSIKEKEAQKESKWNHFQWVDRERLSQMEFSHQKCQVEQDQIKVLEVEKKLKEFQELKAVQKKESFEKYKMFVVEMEKQRKHIFDQVQSCILGNSEMPQEVINPIASNQHKELCSVYQRTSCCQYGDGCSRNHLKPVISRILMIQNFFNHILLDNENNFEQLKELNKSFLDFYFDIRAEFEKFGEIANIFVCFNKIQHLRGNVYVEYKEHKNAIIAFQKLYGRFYDGTTLIVEFASIRSWSDALCYIELNGICTNVLCMYLHIFRTPKIRLGNEQNSTTLHHCSQTTSFVCSILPEFKPEPASKRNMKLCSTIRSCRKSQKRGILKVKRKSKKDFKYFK